MNQPNYKRLERESQAGSMTSGFPRSSWAPAPAHDILQVGQERLRRSCAEESSLQRIGPMATDLHRPNAPPAANRHEAFVEAQLARARTRVRALDLTGAVLGLLIFTLAYGL